MVWAKGKPFDMKWGWGKAPTSARARQVSTAVRRGQGQKSSKISAFQKVSTVQRKYIDVNAATFFNAAAGGTLTTINLTTQGTGNSGRVGRVAVIKSVQGRFAISSTNGAAGLSPAPMIRVIAVYDKETNGVAPTAAQILQADVITSAMDLENAQRYIILADSGILNSTQQGGALAFNAPVGSQVYDFYKKCNLALEWNTGNVGTIADINYGAIYILTYCSGINGAAQPAIYGQAGYTRVRFTDA